MHQITRRESRQLTRDICHEVVRVYQHLDQQAEHALALHAAEGRKVSCRAGCSACCHIATVITRVEALAIADVLHRRPDWLSWAKKMVIAAQPYCDPQYDRHWYFLQRPPCPFLNAEHQCEVYAVRPAPCRYYYVFTPAEQCGDPVKQDVGMIDLFQLSLQMLAFQNATFHNQDSSCLPLMVLQGMMDVGWGCGRSDKILPLLRDLPAPMQWMVDCMKSGKDNDLKDDTHVRRAWEALKAAGVPGTE